MDSGYWEKRFQGARRIDSQFPIDANELRQRVSATIGSSN